MKKLMRDSLLRLIKDESGQSTTEYILILSVVVMIAMKFKGLIGQKLEGILNNVTRDMDRATQEAGN